MAKNLVLAGVNVTIQDEREISAEDCGINFFLQSTSGRVIDGSLTALSALNTFSQIVPITTALEELPDAFFEGFDVILYCGDSQAQALRLNTLTRKSSSVMFWGHAFGPDALFLADFGVEFAYLPDPAAPNPNASSTTTTTKAAPGPRSVTFPTFSEVLAVPWAQTTSRLFPLSVVYLLSRLLLTAKASLTPARAITANDAALLQELWVTMAPAQGLSEQQMSVLSAARISDAARLASIQSIEAVSVLGSVLAQEVIKAVTHVGQPGQPVTVFSATDMVVRTIPIASKQ